MAEITFYNNAFGSESVEVELNDILKAIRSGKWKSIVDEYRRLSANGKTDESDKFKRSKIPGLTASGTFPKARKANEIGKHSGFIAMDFDDIPLDARAELYADDYTYAGFISVGGKGICLLVKIDPKRHIDAFRSLEHYYFTKYGYQVDQSCKDVSRLRFVSADPEMAINPDAKRFDTYLPKAKGRAPKIAPMASTDDDVELVLRQIEADKLDLTASYDTWVQIGMSIAGRYGQSSEGISVFQRVSQFHPDYCPEKTERKYKSFGHPRSNIGIATLFYHAKQAGLQIKSSETKIIETVAKYAKKGRRKAEDAIEQLKKVDGISPEKSAPVVQAIFSGEIDSKIDDEDIVFEVEEFIRRECSVRYNEITLKYETDGVPMNDRDFNSLYLNCKKVIQKVTKDLFLSCIDSDRTPTFNPIKEFFDKHKHRKPTGCIKALADCIETKTGYSSHAGFPEYTQYFVRKWIIGAVAMWHGKHSPLMLVLAGSKQNTGKTHFFRYLLPDEMQSYYAEAELTGDKDENLMMCTKAIIMNDEMSNKSKRDITVLKKLCSTKWFNLRKPYGKLSEDFRRIAALAGTSNSLELLNDPSGNRRIIPIEVDAIKHAAYNAIDKTDLWIEAYHAFKAGETFELTNEDIRKLADSTHQFEEASLEGELLMRFFRPGGYSYLTNSEIKYQIEVRTHQRLNQRKLGMELKRLGFQQSVRFVDGQTKRVYAVWHNDDPANAANSIPGDDEAPY